MTISDSDFAKMRADVDKILTFLGDIDITHAADKARNFNYAGQLANGDLALGQNIHQMREWQNQHSLISEERIKELEARPTAPPPSSTDPDPRIPALQTELGKVKASIAAIPSGPPGGSGVVNIPGLGVGVIFTSPPSPPNPDVPVGVPACTHLSYAGGGDLAWRFVSNTRQDAGAGAPNSYSVPWLCQQRLDFERSAISMNYFKPLVYKPDHPTQAGQPIPPNDYDKKGGKGIIFRPGGQNDDGTRGPSAEIYGGIVGRNFDIGAARTNAGLMDDGGDVRCSGTDPQNPVSIRVEGTRQRVVIKTVNGVRVFAPA